MKFLSVLGYFDRFPNPLPGGSQAGNLSRRYYEDGPRSRDCAFFCYLDCNSPRFWPRSKVEGASAEGGRHWHCFARPLKREVPLLWKAINSLFHILKGLILSLTVQKPSSKKTKSSKDVMTENLRETSIPATPEKAERFSSTKVRGAILWWGEGGHRSYFWVKFCGPYWPVFALEIAFWLS